MAFAGVPLIDKGRVAGVVAAFGCQPFDDRTLQLFQSAAGALAQFIERKRTEEALRESQQTVRLLLDSTAEAIYAIDLHGNCTLANRACLRLLGNASETELLGKNMHQVMHHSHAGGAPYAIEDCRIFQAFLSGTQAHVDDEVLWRADGSNFPAEYWSYPVIREGKMVGAVVTFIDISDRRRNELEQRQLVSVLENIPDFVLLASADRQTTYLNLGRRENDPGSPIRARPSASIFSSFTPKISAKPW